MQAGELCTQALAQQSIQNIFKGSAGAPGGTQKAAEGTGEVSNCARAEGTGEASTDTDTDTDTGTSTDTDTDTSTFLVGQ